MTKVYGEIRGLGGKEIRRLQRLYHPRIPPHEVITQEVARSLAEISREIRRQVGLLISRRGRVECVLVGDDHKVVIPELDRTRKAPERLLGLRLIHTHLKGEPLSKDDLTDLALLRLDFICAIEVRPNGWPGRVYGAYLLPPNPEDRSWEIIEAPGLRDLSLNFLDHVMAVEDEFTRALNGRLVDVRKERAVLVGVYSCRGPKAMASMAELKELARSSGLNVMDVVMQYRPRPDPTFVLGKGKMEELIIRSKQTSADVILFDQDLTPAQLRSISKMTDQKIIDRTQLILDIFAQHAHSRDGKIQVELAQLKYLLPRLAGSKPALSRLRGGIGLRGPGETKLEIDRRRIRDRIARLEEEISKLSKQREGRRAQRRKRSIPIVSIVGYTNAGKSTLLNALTKSRVRVEDKLFATLDPTSRRMRFPREKEVLVTDTVGFIKDLPPDLINAFRATLEELDDADLLLHVADLSNPDMEEQIICVRRILADMGLDRVPELLVLNKMDLVSHDLAQRMCRKYSGIGISALKGIGLEGLSHEIERHLFTPSSVSISLS